MDSKLKATLKAENCPKSLEIDLSQAFLLISHADAQNLSESIMSVRDFDANRCKQYPFLAQLTIVAPASASNSQSWVVLQLESQSSLKQLLCQTPATQPFWLEPSRKEARRNLSEQPPPADSWTPWANGQISDNLCVIDESSLVELMIDSYQSTEQLHNVLRLSDTKCFTSNVVSHFLLVEKNAQQPSGSFTVFRSYRRTSFKWEKKVHGDQFKLKVPANSLIWGEFWLYWILIGKDAAEWTKNIIQSTRISLIVNNKQAINLSTDTPVNVYDNVSQDQYHPLPVSLPKNLRLTQQTLKDDYEHTVYFVPDQHGSPGNFDPTTAGN